MTGLRRCAAPGPKQGLSQQGVVVIGDRDPGADDLQTPSWLLFGGPLLLQRLVQSREARHPLALLSCRPLLMFRLFRLLLMFRLHP